jgi:hypothetical protein
MTSMYGLHIDLPAGWLDLTEYLFEAPNSLVTKLVFSREELLPQDVDAWLEEIRIGVGALGMEATPIRDYANPLLKLRGFDAIVDAGNERAGTNFIVVSFATYAVVIQPQWLDGGEPFVLDLLRSLRLRADAAPVAPLGPELFCYAVYGLLFDSSLHFGQPASFAFQSADERGRMWCTARPRGTAFEAPPWTSRFSLDPDTVLATPSDGAGRIVSPRSLPPELTGPAFEEKHWVITATEPSGVSRQLTWCEAWTEVNAEPFRLWFAHEGDGAEAIATWSSVLTSARRD